MKSPKVCPHCGGYLETNTYGNDWIDSTYIDFVEAKCLGCNRKYTWKEIYPLQAIEDFDDDVDECGFNPYEGAYDYDC